MSCIVQLNVCNILCFTHITRQKSSFIVAVSSRSKLCDYQSHGQIQIIQQNQIYIFHYFCLSCNITAQECILILMKTDRIGMEPALEHSNVDEASSFKELCSQINETQWHFCDVKSELNLILLSNNRRPRKCRILFGPLGF